MRLIIGEQRMKRKECDARSIVLLMMHEDSIFKQFLILRTIFYEVHLYLRILASCMHIR